MVQLVLSAAFCAIGACLLLLAYWISLMIVTQYRNRRNAFIFMFNLGAFLLFISIVSMIKLYQYPNNAFSAIKYQSHFVRDDFVFLELGAGELARFELPRQLDPKQLRAYRVYHLDVFGTTFRTYGIIIHKQDTLDLQFSRFN